MRTAYVYIMSDRYRGGMYTGMTTDLRRRIWQHRHGTGSEFVAEYKFNRLVYIEPYEEIAAAIKREKLIKRWRRPWKFRLIEEANPDWLDLSHHLLME